MQNGQGQNLPGTPPFVIGGQTAAPTPPNNGQHLTDEDDTPKAVPPLANAKGRRSFQLNSPATGLPASTSSGITASLAGLLRNLANALSPEAELDRKVRQTSTIGSSVDTSPQMAKSLDQAAPIAQQQQPRRTESTQGRKTSANAEPAASSSYFALPFAGLFSRTGKDSPGGTVPGGVVLGKSQQSSDSGLKLDEASAQGEVFEDTTSSPSTKLIELSTISPKNSFAGKPASRASSLRLHEAVLSAPSRRTTVTPQNVNDGKRTPRASLSLDTAANGGITSKRLNVPGRYSDEDDDDENVELDPISKAISSRQSMRLDRPAGNGTPPTSPRQAVPTPSSAGSHGRTLSLPFSSGKPARPGNESGQGTVLTSEPVSMSDRPNVRSPEPRTPTSPSTPVEKPKKTLLSRLKLGGQKAASERHKRSASTTSATSSISEMLPATPSPPTSPLPKSGSSATTNLADLDKVGDGSQEDLKSTRVRYIKVKTKNKDKKELKHLFLAQELSIPLPEALRKDPDTASLASNDDRPRAKRRRKAAIWAMAFSSDGKYLAAAGQDGVVRVWVVQGGTVPSTDRKESEDPISTNPPPTPTSAASAGTSGMTKKRSKLAEVPVFASAPIHEYTGHTADVLDLSWSKNNFLLSSSMDKTVRLWHVSRKDCLSAFLHLDVAVAVRFHPLDDRFFLSGSLDCKLRLWNVPEKKVHAWTELPELITAVAFASNGKIAVAGSFVGRCTFFEIETFRYNSQLVARSGRTKKGKKVTAICTLPGQPANGEKVLVTTNDSRMRLFHLVDRSCIAKYRGGHVNDSSQIRASFSEDGRYVITGSEDRNVYIYDSGVDQGGTFVGWLRGKEDKCAFESFPVESDIATCCVFAPEGTQRILSRSSDIILGQKEALSALNSRQSRVSTAESSSSADTASTGVGKGLEDAIIVVSDDHTGVIRVYRNSPLPKEFAATLVARRASHLVPTRSRADSVASAH